MKLQQAQEQLRNLPSVSKFLNLSEIAPLVREQGEGFIKYVLTTLLDEIREEIRSGKRSAIPAEKELIREVKLELERLSPQNQRVVNATGIILHTALGRAPFSDSTTTAVANSTKYCVVQVDPKTNLRSRRDERIEAALQYLTGCEAATVVTNNAAATFMLLNVMSEGKEAIISRGQLVEIGGEFRMPDVMDRSGAIMREVGTTNRTHLKDYAAAINENTGVIIFVHPSNYSIQGFASTPSLEELCELGIKHNIPVIADLGAGSLIDLKKYGVKDAVSIAEAIKVGAAITCSSGDKLICGPQSGVICGKKEFVDKVRKSPFARMFRTDKLMLAALEETLHEFVRGDFEKNLPLYQMLSISREELQTKAEKIVLELKKVSSRYNYNIDIVEDSAFVGGGTLPTEAIPAVAISFSIVGASDKQLSDFARDLRTHPQAVYCRFSDGRLIFNLRTLLVGDEDLLSNSLQEAMKNFQ
jgi:L-seryl-tRNA(Ser) seleniumtransferase